jgi:hypothetical protein
MLTSKLTSIQKFGLGITSMSLLWLVLAWNENNITLEERTIMEGKIANIEFRGVGKYASDTAWYCTLDNGRKFYANNYLHDLSQHEFYDILRNSKRVKLWVRKDLRRYETISPYQFVVDDVMYIDFNKSHSVLPDNFWFCIAALLLGTMFILEPAIKNILLRGRKGNPTS